MNIQLDDFSMAYEARGQGLPLVWVHGFPLNRTMWAPQLEQLSTHAYVLAPDLRGHGESSAGSKPYSLDQMADDLAALLDALGITRPVVLGGLSMGGYITFAFCRRHAHRLAGIILAATRATPDTPEGRLNRDKAAGLARREGPAAVGEGMLPRLLAPETYQQRPKLVEAVRSMMATISLAGMLGDLAGMRDRPDSTSTLAGINLPALVLHGEADQLVGLGESQLMAERLPQGRLQVVPAAGHLLNLEQPQLFNRAVRQFLATLAG